MTKTKITIAALAVIMSTTAFANEFEAQLSELASGPIAGIATNDTVIRAVKAQNLVTAGYSQAKIDELDQTWRAEVGAGEQPMITEVLSKAISEFLVGAQDESAGVYTEIFVMDGLGLNVGQSSVTSDYWQGDEGKFQNTFGAGAGSVDLSEVELDESSQTFQSQVSIPVLDETGAPIGAITVGVDVGML